MRYKKQICSLIYAMICFAGTPVWAEQASPITIEADYLHYEENTGFVRAIGNIKMQQGITTIYTDDEMTGDVHTGDVHAEGKVRWVENNNVMTGNKLDYNVKTKLGKMGENTGNLDGYLVSGQSTDFFADHSTTYGGTLTKCPAQDPDYKFTAEKVEIYPDDKLVAYKASFWIKGVKIYTMAKFVKSLKEEGESSLPRIGYESDNGFYLKQYLEYPLGDGVSATVDLRYYSKRGMKNQLGLIQRADDYTLTLIDGSDYNTDNEWFRRSPELTFTTKKRPINDSPWNYYFRLQSGLIRENAQKELWRNGATFYLNRDPITLGANTTLALGASYEYNWYEGSKERGLLNTGIALRHKLNDHLAAGIGYNHAQESGGTPFRYDRMRIANELTWGVSWQVDHLWNVGVKTSYNLDLEKYRDIDYVVTRNLHCFNLTVAYREKREQWLVNIDGIYF